MRGISSGKFRLYKKTINLFDWESLLNNLDVNKQVSVFNETIMNFMSNFAPNELVTCDDQDPPWMNCYTKNLIVAINDFRKVFSALQSFYVQNFAKPVNSVDSHS